MESVTPGGGGGAARASERRMRTRCGRVALLAGLGLTVAVALTALSVSQRGLSRHALTADVAVNAGQRRSKREGMEDVVLQLEELEEAVRGVEEGVGRRLERLKRVLEEELYKGKSYSEEFIGQQYVTSFTSQMAHLEASHWSISVPKTVLIWSEYYTEGVLPLQEDFDFNHCRVSNCQWTSDRTRFADADAVWFHLVAYPPKKKLLRERVSPPPRPTPNQVWIASSQEWESVTCVDAVTHFDHFFNWTMSYKMDSDIWWPYGVAVRTPMELRKPNSQWRRVFKKAFNRKTHMVLFLSHKTRVVESRRMEYVNQLAKYIQVDIAGNDSWVPDWKLFQNLWKKYRFVLSFENALCRDYVTEKFWKLGLMHDAIPVVRNGLTKEDISKVAPPGSYINARDFEGPKQLAEYLHKVASNKKLFTSFFEWKKKYTLKFDLREDIRFSFEMATGDSMNSWCKICEKLHDPNLSYRTVKFSDSWCYENRGPLSYATKWSQCALVDDLPPL